MHEHSGHDHEHHHEHGEISREETVAALGYMLRHNEHHAEELRDIAHGLEHLGYARQAGEVLRAVADFESGNARLKSALEEVK